MLRAPVAPGLFPPQDTILAQALACELRVDLEAPSADPPSAPEADAATVPVTAATPATPAAPATSAARSGTRRKYPIFPLSRFSVSDVCDQLQQLGVPMSYSTVQRTLARAAIRPWEHEQWLFPRDPLLLDKATPVLELYHGYWEGERLGPRDYVLSADEMTGLQAISRIHATVPAGPKRRRRYEFEYERHGTLCYLGFLDVFTGMVYGETSAKSGIDPFESALRRLLEQRRYQQAERLFLIVDNGSSHHPSTSPDRLRAQHPNLTTVHLPVHSSWLNQIEIYFSIVHRKALTPLDFDSLAALEQRLKWFQWHYNQYAQPFQWNYTREKLEKLVQRLEKHEDWLAEARGALQARQERQTAATQPVMN
jgi:hypothetical protein